MYHRFKGLSFAAALRDMQASKSSARVAAAEVLGRASSEEEREQALQLLSQAIADPVPAVRSTVCMSLAELERDEAWQLLAACLSDSVSEVRQSAAMSLGSLGVPDSFDALAAALQDGPADLRFQVATSLAEVDLQRAYEPLLAVLADESDAEVLGAIALSLGAIGNAACADKLALLLDHNSPQTRFDAAYALAQLGDPRSRETLAAALCDDGGWDAVVALELLGGDSIPALREFVDGQAGAMPVRLRAAGSLLTLAEPGQEPEGARRCLVDGLRSRKQEIRGLALQQIEQHGGSWALPALRALRTSFRGRSMRDEIDAVLATLAERKEES